MLKLIGSVMVFGSCAALGLSARQNLRRRVAAADAMLLALGLIRSEISGRRTPMPEIVDLLTENEQPIVRKVFRTLQRRLREQNGLSLGYLWRSTLRDCRAQVGLGTQECDILCDAANYLGRYDADEQLTGLSQVERRLAASREAAQEDLANRGNLYRTCGIALGLLVILVLLPLQMLSGGSTPRESMPQMVQDIMLTMPTTHFVSLAQAILYRGAGFEIVWPQFLTLMAIGGAFFTIALLRFRKTIGTMA